MIPGIKVSQATYCSLSLRLGNYMLTVNNGTVLDLTSGIDYGCFFTIIGSFEDPIACWQPETAASNTTLISILEIVVDIVVDDP
jgi:hypothetical protein